MEVLLPKYDSTLLDNYEMLNVTIKFSSLMVQYLELCFVELFSAYFTAPLHLSASLMIDGKMM